MIIVNKNNKTLLLKELKILLKACRLNISNRKELLNRCIWIRFSLLNGRIEKELEYIFNTPTIETKLLPW